MSIGNEAAFNSLTAEGGSSEVKGLVGGGLLFEPNSDNKNEYKFNQGKAYPLLSTISNELSH